MAWVSDTVFSLLILASGSFAASTLWFAVAWIRARERAVRAEQRVVRAPTDDDRVDRLEQALDTMEVEVGRVAEGQQFVSRLLRERAGQVAETSVRPAYASPPR